MPEQVLNMTIPQMNAISDHFAEKEKENIKEDLRRKAREAHDKLFGKSKMSRI